MPVSPILAKRRSSYAGAVAAHGLDSPQARASKTELATDIIIQRIEQVVAAAPPLSAEQRERIITALMTARPAAKPKKAAPRRNGAA